MPGLGDTALARLVKRPARLRRVRPLRVQEGLDRLLSDGNLSVAQKGLLDAVDPRIHPDDEMFLGDPDHYFAVGLSAITCIETALAQPDSAPAAPEPERILDFAGGYGRVHRFLAARFPDAERVAADVQPPALEFCTEQFGAATIGAPVDPLELRLTGDFDLIWCGSLLTHLDAERIRAVLGQFASALTPGGVAVVSTHGSFAAGHEWTLEPLAAEDRSRALREFEADGAGYAPYPETPHYGVSLTTPDWIRGAADEAGLEPGNSAERAWASHQDVIALWKPAEPQAEPASSVS